MSYKVLSKPMTYQDCPIYVRNDGEKWEYLTVIGGEIYTSYIVARLPFVRRITGRGYTKKMVHDTTNYMIAMAQATIDTVLQIEHK